MDLDLPLEVDDEYWDHPDPTQRFRQPPGKPSRVSSLVYLIKLFRIVGLALRTIASIPILQFTSGTSSNSMLSTRLSAPKSC